MRKISFKLVQFLVLFLVILFVDITCNAEGLTIALIKLISTIIETLFLSDFIYSVLIFIALSILLYSGISLTSSEERKIWKITLLK